MPTAQELFFHAMGGREGWFDTDCKTAKNGYIQRRLVKATGIVMARSKNDTNSGINSEAICLKKVSMQPWTFNLNWRNIFSF